jgi:prepilin-type N-terminal cleavage/methylation domain-containing protein
MTERYRMPTAEGATIHSPAILAGSTVISLERDDPSRGARGLRVRPARMAGLSRHGITLVELLIAMAIIAIITAAVLGTAQAAMESARRSRTQSLVTKIDRLIAEKVASYETRRIDVDSTLIADLDVWVNKATSQQERVQRLKDRGMLLAELRLLGVRELMKYEMPDRWTDIALNNQLRPQIVLSSPPAVVQAYWRQYMLSRNAQNFYVNQGAECLYLTVMNTTGDGEARTQFSAQDIADTDGDGALEFIDGWRRPISWLRWAPGFVSTLQPRDPVTGLPPADGEHDSLDLFGRDRLGAHHPDYRGIFNTGRKLRTLPSELDALRSRAHSAFRLTPLIFSTGRDGESGINSKDDNYVPNRQLDPYFVGNTANSLAPGTVDNRNAAIDNIHNHITNY